MMENEDLDENERLAVKVMGSFIGSRDTKGYTKETLMKTYGFDDQLADELTQVAWEEWMDTYSD